MGFYGNITNTARTQFQFDRVFPSRYEMERTTFTDGVYAGRYVLIEYDENLSLDNFLRIQFIEGIAYYNPTGTVGNRTRVTYSIVRPGEMVYTAPDDKTVENGLQLTECVFYTCIDDGKNNLPDASAQFKATEITDANVSNYTKNYNIDTKMYGTGRGYDSTVWQKVYSDGGEKYVMIAELNTVVPTFDVSADAPTLAPVVPHFDVNSTDVYYKLHWQPSWGFRIASNTEGISDETTIWAKEVYNAATDKNDKFYYDITTETWVQYSNIDEIKNLPADIFYNAAGFDNTTSNHIDLDDEVIVRPTGKSGNLYNRHDGNDGLVEKEDIQELSIVLPSIGNTIASVWDVIYGVNAENDNKRYRDIEWKDAVAIENNAEQNTEIGGMTRDLTTVAGCINSVHDLMGMIITSKSDDYLNEEWYNKNYIYKEDGKYYRILEYPTYELVEYETVLPKRESYVTDQEFLAAYEEVVNDLFAVDTEYFILKDNNANRSAERLNKRAVSTLPSGTKVGYVTGVGYEFIEIPSLAKNFGTLHGIVLQMQKMLEQQDVDTRDRSTVSGTINTLNDIINLFDSLVPGEFLICDIDGKVNSANWTTAQDYEYTNHGARVPVPTSKTFNTRENRWISLSLNETDRVFEIEHIFNEIDDTATTSDKNDSSKGNGINKPDSATTVDDTLKLYTPIVDAMGHVVGKNVETVTLPYGYKTFTTIGNNILNTTEDLDTTQDKVSADGVTVTPGKPIENSSTTADNTQDSVAINPHNKWLQVKIDEDVITIAHEVHGIKINPLTSDLNNGTDTITIQDTVFDAAGHVTENHNHTYTLPYGYKTFKTDGWSTENGKDLDAVQDSIGGEDGFTVIPGQSGSETSVTADNTQDIMTINPFNKWIQLKMAEDKIEIAHEVHGIYTKPLETDLNDGTDTITFQDLEFDDAGHVTKNQKHTYTLPYGYKFYKVTNTEDSVVDAPATVINADGQIADTTQDTLTLSASNRWIKLDNNTDDTIKVGHKLSAFIGNTSPNWLYGLIADETIATLDADNTFEVPCFQFDEAGHILEARTHTVTIPENFKSITVVTSDVKSGDKTNGTAGVLTADTLEDDLTIAEGNRWINIDADINGDKLTFSHYVEEIDLSTNTTNLNTSNVKTIPVHELVWDAAGHITSNVTHTYTIPDNIKTVAIQNSGSATVAVDAVAKDADLTAETMVDTVTFDTGNRWIQFVGNAANDKVTVYHAAPGGKTISTSVTGNETPNFGSTFKIPEIKYDEAGHITEVSTHTVQIPIPSLNDFNANETNVITSLTMEPSTGAITQGSTGVSSLKLSYYSEVNHTNRDDNNDINNGDTINDAFKKLQTQMYEEEIARAEAVLSEAQSREADDKVLDGKITEEANARENADGALELLIGQEVADRKEADGNLEEMIQTEKSERELAIEGVSEAIGDFKTLVEETYLPKTDYINPEELEFTYNDEQNTLQLIINDIANRLAAIEAVLFPPQEPDPEEPPIEGGEDPEEPPVEGGEDPENPSDNGGENTEPETPSGEEEPQS